MQKCCNCSLRLKKFAWRDNGVGAKARGLLRCMIFMRFVNVRNLSQRSARGVDGHK